MQTTQFYCGAMPSSLGSVIIKPFGTNTFQEESIFKSIILNNTSTSGRTYQIAFRDGGTDRMIISGVLDGNQVAIINSFISAPEGVQLKLMGENGDVIATISGVIF